MMRLISILAALAIAASGCAGAEPSTPATASITSPASGAELTLGPPVAIVGRAAGASLRNVQVVGDGLVLATIAAPAGATEVPVNQVWSPDSAGSHIVQIKGLNDKGEIIASSEVIFRLRAPAPTPAPIPTATAQQLVPTSPPLPTAAPTAVGPTPAPTVSARPVLSVTNDFVNIRAAANTNAALVGRLNLGQTAPVIGKSEDGKWWQIELQGAPSAGWVFGELVRVAGDVGGVPVVKADAATPAPTVAPTAAARPTVTATAAVAATTAAPTSTAGAPQVVVTNDFVNVRTGPGTAYAQVGRLEINQAAAVRGKSADGKWWQVVFAQASGGLAWVIGEYVRFEGDPARVAVVAAPPLPTAAPAPIATPAITATRVPTTSGGVGGFVASVSRAAETAMAVPEAVRTLMSLYNEARAEAGLKPLAYSGLLSAVAQAHAADLATTGKGSHTGSDGSTARTRITRAGFAGRYMGENWAWARSVEQAFDMWFHKEYPDGVHRRSILSPNYTLVGIGIAKSNGGYFFIANFGG